MSLKTIDCLAETLGVAKNTAYRLIGEGKIGPPIVVRVGGSIRINETELDRWIAGGGATRDQGEAPDER